MIFATRRGEIVLQELYDVTFRKYRDGYIRAM
jgi:hypothetical protein